MLMENIDPIQPIFFLVVLICVVVTIIDDYRQRKKMSTDDAIRSEADDSRDPGLYWIMVVSEFGYEAANWDGDYWTMVGTNIRYAPHEVKAVDEAKIDHK